MFLKEVSYTPLFDQNIKTVIFEILLQLFSSLKCNVTSSVNISITVFANAMTHYSKLNQIHY